MKLSNRLSSSVHRLAAPLKRRILQWRLASAVAGLPVPVPVTGRTRLPSEAATVIVIHKEHGRVRGIEGDTRWLESRNGFSTAWRRLPAILDVVGDAAVEDGAWSADLGDWVQSPGEVIGFCSRHDDTLLVPDRGFHASRGYESERRRAAMAPRFEDRDPRVLWRGSPTGQGHSLADPLVADNAALIQRVRMCLRMRDDPMTSRGETDLRIVVNDTLPRQQVEAYRRAGITGPHVAQASWSSRRYAIDIDGHANAFSNFFLRLLYGCCVIKVASPLGFRQWYYDRLVPWEHFVPVVADLGDLAETLAWCLSHARECRRIAAAGQRVALAMTHASERRKAVEMLAARRDGADATQVISLPTVRTVGDNSRRRAA
jgi:hypothetical protein